MFEAARFGVHGALGRYLAALEFRDYRRLWSANLAAQAAAWALIVTRGWLVYDMTDSSMAVGLVTFAAMAPLLLVPPFAGVLADRVDRRSLLAWTYAINLFHNLLLAFLALSGQLAEWHILLLSLVNGAARAAQTSTSQALAANLVPRHRLLNALSLSSATQHGSRLVGPGLVAPLLALLGAPAAFLLCSLLYGLGWLQVRRIETVSRGGVAGGEPFLDSFTAGLRYAWGQPVIRSVLMLMFFHCGLTMAYESLIPSIASEYLALSGGGVGVLMAAVGAGALVGSVYIGGVESARRRGQLLLAMGLLSGLGQGLLAVAPNVTAALLALAIMGGTQAAYMTLGAAITQTLADDRFRGRISSINIFSLSGIMSAMNLANGMLGMTFHAGAVLLVSGLAFAGIVFLSFAVATPRRLYVRGLPSEAPSPALS